MKRTPIVFDGLSFYYHRGYYVRTNKPGESGPTRLHRAIWEAHHGAIPDGWHVHHVNHDHTDNRIENLQLLSAKDHAAHHNSIFHKGIPALMAWKKTPEGIAKQKEWGTKAFAARPFISGQCAVCGTEFKTQSLVRRFCTIACRAAANRPPEVQKIVPCEVCANPVPDNTRSKTKRFCSKKCRQVACGRRRYAVVKANRNAPHRHCPPHQ